MSFSQRILFLKNKEQWSQVNSSSWNNNKMNICTKSPLCRLTFFFFSFYSLRLHREEWTKKGKWVFQLVGQNQRNCERKRFTPASLLAPPLSSAAPTHSVTFKFIFVIGLKSTVASISWTTIYSRLVSLNQFPQMNQPQCAVIARRGCRTAETEGRVATHPSWTKAALFPPSVRTERTAWAHTGHGTGTAHYGSHRKNTPCSTFHGDGRSAEQWGFIPASRDAVVGYVTTRAPSLEAAGATTPKH